MALAFLRSSRVEGSTVGLPSLGAAASLLVTCLQPTTLDNIPKLLSPTYGVWTLIEGTVIMPDILKATPSTLACWADWRVRTETNK